MAGGSQQKPSLRRLARLLGVSDMAVRKAVKGGVFPSSIQRDGAGIAAIDYSLAVEEWERSGRRLRGGSRVAPPPVPAQTPLGAASSSTEPAEFDDDDPEDEDPPLPPDAPPSLVDAQREATQERARKLRLENNLREGQLVEAGAAAREAYEFARTLREAILNVPARVAAELAVETDASRVHIRLDAALREALQSTATDVAAGDGDRR